MDTSGVMVFAANSAAQRHVGLQFRKPVFSRVALFPKTGRSHQLRVHMKSIGHAILGDRFYATGAALEAFPRLCLHAKSLRLRHPSGGEWVSFESPVPF